MSNPAQVSSSIDGSNPIGLGSASSRPHLTPPPDLDQDALAVPYLSPKPSLYPVRTYAGRKKPARERAPPPPSDTRPIKLARTELESSPAPSQTPTLSSHQPSPLNTSPPLFVNLNTAVSHLLQFGEAFTDLQAQLAQAQAAAATADAARAQAQQEVIALHAQLGKVQNELEEETNTLTLIKNDKDEAERELSQLRCRRLSAEVKLGEEVAGLKKDVREARNELAGVRAELDGARAKVGEVEAAREVDKADAALGRQVRALAGAGGPG